MRFSDTGRTEQGDVGFACDEFQGGQIADFTGVELRLERELELVECFVVRQTGQLKGGAEPAAFVLILQRHRPTFLGLIHPPFSLSSRLIS